ncbi:hypothetical protein BD310DRAFT_935520 [Dichomitus squalens]|uniref:Uncharacterized protein n=1 Tax=Dichomitus squalens TaxID=114155 RepID=A0A4Q9PKD7_9APHY|nr:hypothetical protein BD310DRAFT_935520 [Dichomitus squalens]
MLTSNGRSSRIALYYVSLIGSAPEVSLEWRLAALVVGHLPHVARDPRSKPTGYIVLYSRNPPPPLRRMATVRSRASWLHTAELPIEGGLPQTSSSLSHTAAAAAACRTRGHSNAVSRSASSARNLIPKGYTRRLAPHTGTSRKDAHTARLPRGAGRLWDDRQHACQRDGRERGGCDQRSSHTESGRGCPSLLEHPTYARSDRNTYVRSVRGRRLPRSLSGWGPLYNARMGPPSRHRAFSRQRVQRRSVPKDAFVPS